MKTQFALLIILGLLTASCTEKIDLTLDESGKRVVVEGKISNTDMHQLIRITESTAYFYNKPAPAVSGAFVKVSGDSKDYIFEEKEPGNYYSKESFSGKTGGNYTLTIEYKGVIYNSGINMPTVPKVDSIQLEKAYIPLKPGVIMDPQKDYYNILLFAHEPGQTENYYMMDAYKNGECLTQKLTDKMFSDDFFINGKYVKAMKAIQVDAVKGDTIKFVLSSIDKGYYKYLFALQQSAMSGSPFVGPASNAAGNISNDALGFFYPCASSSKTFILK